MKLTILSPLYPKLYPPNLDCEWRIVGFSNDARLQFNVTDLFLSREANEACDNAEDYIEILNVDPATQNVSGKCTLILNK